MIWVKAEGCRVALDDGRELCSTRTGGFGGSTGSLAQAPPPLTITDAELDEALNRLAL